MSRVHRSLLFMSYCDCYGYSTFSSNPLLPFLAGYIAIYNIRQENPRESGLASQWPLLSMKKHEARWRENYKATVPELVEDVVRVSRYESGPPHQVKP